jgi:F1F0 ATPase subunit 2
MTIQILALPFLWGALLAAAYSGALWWTVRRLPITPRPVLWTVGSYYLRLAALGLGFYVAGAGSFPRLAATFAGFLLARLLILRSMKPPTEDEPELAKENR